MKDSPIITQRLVLHPASNEEIFNMIGRTQDADLQQAYSEMLQGGADHPDGRNFYVPWLMVLRDTDTVVGSVGFRGVPEQGAVEIGYGVDSRYEGRGYTTEAVRAMMEWAFCQEGVCTIWAETAPDNKASQHVLEKLQFRPDGRGEEGPRYRLEKAAMASISV